MKNSLIKQDSLPPCYEAYLFKNTWQWVPQDFEIQFEENNGVSLPAIEAKSTIITRPRPMPAQSVATPIKQAKVEEQAGPENQELGKEMIQQLLDKSNPTKAHSSEWQKIDLEKLCQYKELPGHAVYPLDQANKEGVSVIFLGERPKDFQDDSENDVLSRMIKAMNLSTGDFARIYIETDNNDFQSLIFKDLRQLAPSVLVCLGAAATRLALMERKRLSQVHGEVFKRSFIFPNQDQVNIQIMPVFHPDFLVINPNMKRSAWIDLQKVMKLIGK